jgi:aquaporin Z
MSLWNKNPVLVFVTEIIGTFILLSAILMSGGNALAIGLALAVGIVLGGAISGGNFNPAVSFIMFLQESMSAMECMFYIIAQLLGGVFALGYYRSYMNAKGKLSSQ